MIPARFAAAPEAQWLLASAAVLERRAPPAQAVGGARAGWRWDRRERRAVLAAHRPDKRRTLWSYAPEPAVAEEPPPAPEPELDEGPALLFAAHRLRRRAFDALLAHALECRGVRHWTRVRQRLGVAALRHRAWARSRARCVLERMLRLTREHLLTRQGFFELRLHAARVRAGQRTLWLLEERFPVERRAPRLHRVEVGVYRIFQAWYEVVVEAYRRRRALEVLFAGLAKMLAALQRRQLARAVRRWRRRARRLAATGAEDDDDDVPRACKCFARWMPVRLLRVDPSARLREVFACVLSELADRDDPERARELMGALQKRFSALLRAVGPALLYMAPADILSLLSHPPRNPGRFVCSHADHLERRLREARQLMDGLQEAFDAWWASPTAPPPSPPPPPRWAFCGKCLVHHAPGAHACPGEQWGGFEPECGCDVFRSIGDVREHLRCSHAGPPRASDVAKSWWVT